MALRTIPTVGWALTLISSSTAAARCCREPPPRAKGSTIACGSTSLLVRESMVSLATRRGIVGVPTGVGKPGLPAVTNAGLTIARGRGTAPPSLSPSLSPARLLPATTRLDRFLISPGTSS